MQWIYLGKICNQKPSSIFKISKLKHEGNALTSMVPFGGGGAAPVQTSPCSACIGISVEPIAQIDALTPATDSKASLDNDVQFTEKMLQNFYNYASSFAKDAPDGQYVSKA